MASSHRHRRVARRAASAWQSARETSCDAAALSVRRRHESSICVVKPRGASQGRRSRRSRVEAPNLHAFSATAVWVRWPWASADAILMLAEVNDGTTDAGFQRQPEGAGSARWTRIDSGRWSVHNKHKFRHFIRDSGKVTRTLTPLECAVGGLCAGLRKNWPRRRFLCAKSQRKLDFFEHLKS